MASQRRALLALGQPRGAARLAAVVLRDAGARRAGDRSRARGPRALRAQEPRAHLLRLDGADPALVRLAPALVGAPAAGLVLQLRRDDRPGRAADALPVLRLGRARARPGRARHVVLLGALAVRDARLARGDAALPRVLPRARARHGARHHQPLGRAHDDDGHRVHGPRAVPRRRDPLDGARERRPAHVEVARHRRRSARSDRQARRRRHALRAAQDELDAGRALRRGRDRGGPRALQQALERGPHDPALRRRGGRARARALRAGRRLDPRPAGRRRGRGDRCDRRLRLRGRGQGALPLHLERRLRLVSRGLQGAPLRRRCGRQARRLADAALRAALDPAARPSRAAARDRAHLGRARRGGRAGSQLPGRTPRRRSATQPPSRPWSRPSTSS